MVDWKNINNNIIANRWKQRYTDQLTDIKVKLDRLNEIGIEEYQLQVIKRTRAYPRTGDLFEVSPKEDITLYGVVINNHINNINGEDLLLVLIFKEQDIKTLLREGVKNEHLLIPPQIVGKEYWTRGYFYNIDFVEEMNIVDTHGFYNVGKRKFSDEYGNDLDYEPRMLGIYGVSTLSGVARKVNQELIIAGAI